MISVREKNRTLINQLKALFMKPRRADSLTQSLLHETILHDWFHPMKNALDKVRFSDAIFQSLPMVSFMVLGGLRQLLSITTLREQVQALFHWDSTAERARTTLYMVRCYGQ